MKKFPIGTWFYHPADAFPPEEVDIWNNCGMTYTFSPKIDVNNEDPSLLIPFLDRAASYGMKLIAYVCGMENGNYRENFEKVYSVLKGHPALGGFYIMDEPSSAENFNSALERIRIQKEIASELEPYLNLSGGTAEMDNVLGYGSLSAVMNAIKSAGADTVCFDAYTQMINPVGKNNFFKDVKQMVDAAREADLTPWLTPICTAHYEYKIPTEYQIVWQINMAAALGCGGVIWFRYYDRLISPHFHGSPIDQYHNLTPQYYMMLRAQRTFSDHYGELFMKLKHKKTFSLGNQLGDYPLFGEGDHDLISMENYLDSIVSFFEDEKGLEYMAVVNASFDEFTRWPMHFDEKKCTVTLLTFNGEGECVMHGDDDYDCNTFLYPGQMNLFRIDRK